MKPIYSRVSTKPSKGLIMSTNTNSEYKEIIAGLNRLSDEIHSLSNNMTRLDERLVALDQKVDNRVNSVEVQVKGLETRVQSLVDKCQDIEIRINRYADGHKALAKDFEQEKDVKRNWVNRFFIPLLLLIVSAVGGSLLTIQVAG